MTRVDRPSATSYQYQFIMTNDAFVCHLDGRCGTSKKHGRMNMNDDVFMKFP